MVYAHNLVKETSPSENRESTMLNNYDFKYPATALNRNSVILQTSLRSIF